DGVVDADRVRQEVPVGGNLPERDLGTGALLGEEHLVEPRWAAVEDAESIAPRLDLEERLDLAVDQELVTEDAVEVEQVEDQEAGAGIEHAGGQHQRDIVEQRRERVARRLDSRQPEPGGLVAGVELVEQAVEP